MERRAFRVNGFLVLLVLLVLAGGAAAVSPARFWASDGSSSSYWWPVGFTVVNPNEARVVQFFGRYVGIDHEAGLPVDRPVQHQAQVSLRVRNFETAKLKVSDADGNPVEIAAVVV